MRTIKFRGYTTQDGIESWVYGDLICHANSFYYIKGKVVDTKFCVDSDTIGQFTGLCDRNGTEIYEGDIVRSGEKNFHVAYWNECARFTATARDYDFIGILKLKETEVIGNIHDNPELLEAKDGNVP